MSNSLVDMYAKCGSIEDAWKVFNRMPAHDVVSWSAIILGHVKCGHGLKALGLYQQMQQEGVKPVPVTFVGILNDCASVAALKKRESMSMNKSLKVVLSLMFLCAIAFWICMLNVEA